jgi:acyl-coenzyme A synthetase/AMP-(fatty) acid ligase
VIKITDEPIARIENATDANRGEIGELIVRGLVVTDRYVTSESANALHKIVDGVTLWHRMGDVGYLDADNRFWFCGRKSQRVRTAEGTMFTIPCEAIINQHPAVYRSALVGVGAPGRQEPVIIAQPWPEHWPRDRVKRAGLSRALLELAHGHALTRSVRRIYFRKSLPVDIRHNAKIFREKLAQWAARK